MEYDLIIIFLTLLFSAFFSGMEIAYLNSNRLKVQLDISKGTLKGKVLDKFYKNESTFIAMLLLGNNIALVVYGIFFAKILDPIIYNWGIHDSGLILLIQTIISTVIVLVTAEFLPKALFQINPNLILQYLAFPMRIIYDILYLPTMLVVAISNGIMHLFGEDTKNNTKVFSKIDLEQYVHDINERMDEEQDLGTEVQILQNALDFSSIRARDCMIPRTEIIALDLNDSIETLHQTFIETGLSKILIYRDTIDNIIGYVHSFELFKRPESIKQILLPISFVPSSTFAKNLLEQFAKQSGNIVIVVDEFGGTAGIVTIEDVIEKIFGDIEDEHDLDDWVEQRINEKEILFSGRAEINYINTEYNLDLPESDEYETLGGLVINELESIPVSDTIIFIGRYKLTIEQVSDRKIELIRLNIQ